MNACRVNFGILMIILSLCIIGFLPLPCAAEIEPSYSIAVSVAPLAGLVDSVGGAYVGSSVLLPEGTEPHAAELPTESVNTANAADLLVFTGHFQWELDLAEQVNVPFITFHDDQALANFEDYGARLSSLPGHHEEENNHEHEGNPHAWWLLPSNAIAIANATRVALTILDGSLSDYFDTMFDDFVSDVASFNNLVESTDETYHFSNLKAIVVFPAEAYVAEAFGIEAVAFLQEESVQISGQELLEVQEALRNGSVNLILGSDVAKLQAAGEFAYQLIEDYGGTLIWWRVVFFEGLSDYISIMTHNLGALTSGLEDRASGILSNQALTLGLAVLSGILAIIVIIETLVIVQRSRTS